MEGDAAQRQQLMAARNHLLLELEIGDAIDEEAADAVVAVVDMHLIALAPQLLGGGKAGRAGADDADGPIELAPRPRRLDPAFGEGGLGDVFLDRADGHGIEALLDDAIALAEAVLRTDAAAHFGHVVSERAMDLAIGDAALRASARLLLGALRVELAVDFPEIVPALGRAALRRHGLLHRDAFQQPLRH